MSKGKYPCIFSSQMETIVFIILQIFFATRAVLKIGEYSRIFPSFSWGIFGRYWVVTYKFSFFLQTSREKFVDS